MRCFASSLLGLGSAALLLAPPALAGGGDPEKAQLKFKPAKKWNVFLPKETWTDVSGGIPIPHANGDSFKAFKDSLALKLSVDTNADGKVDKTVKGAKGFLVLKGKNPDGSSLVYACRFRAAGKKYEFATAGWMTGSVAGTSIRLIDQNNNGLYNEVGVDAIVVGKSKSASYLGDVVNLGGSLYSLNINGSGSEVEAVPFEGETGTLNLAAGYKNKCKLDAAIVQSTDGKMSFELAAARKGLLVPAGDYRVVAGQVSRSGETARIATGKMSTLTVNLGRETKQAWGGPIMAEFTHRQDGETVKVEPGSLHWYGKAGEEYVDLLPQGASPKFLVYDEVTERLLKSGRFGT